MKSLLIEASVLEHANPSGVSYFTDGLAAALEEYAADTIRVRYLWLNFLNKKQPKNPLLVTANRDKRLVKITVLPQRAYAKLIYLGIAPTLLVKKTDWILFPNFYTWPILPKRKVAVVVHDLCFLRHPNMVEEKNRKFLLRTVPRAVKRADLIVAVSQFTKNELIELLNVPEEKIVAINIPVNSTQFSTTLDTGTTHLSDRFNITKPYILGISTLEPRKNFDGLVKAYCALPKKTRNSYGLVIAGGWGWKSQDLKTLIEHKQKEGFDIVLTGRVSTRERATLYRNATVLGLVSHYEGFGMPLLEAFHCKVPVVAADIPVLHEVGGDACAWSDRDPKSIARQLNRVLNSTALRTELIEKGTKRVSEYSWSITAQKVAEKLNEHKP